MEIGEWFLHSAILLTWFYNFASVGKLGIQMEIVKKKFHTVISMLYFYNFVY